MIAILDPREAFRSMIIGVAAWALAACGSATAPSRSPTASASPVGARTPSAFAWNYNHFTRTATNEFDPSLLKLPVPCTIVIATRDPHHPALNWRDEPPARPDGQIVLAVGLAGAICAYDIAEARVVIGAERRGADTFVQLEARPGAADINGGFAVAVPAPAASGRVRLELTEVPRAGGPGRVTSGDVGVDSE